MQDGTAKTITADEYRAAPKPLGASTDPGPATKGPGGKTTRR